MKIAYIITAYKNPFQLARLVQRLMHKDVIFYIHIDKSSNIKTFLKELSKISNSKNIYCVKRERSYWGHFNFLKAILNGINDSLKDNNVDRIVLLSGQDYPIKSNEFIFNFFNENSNKNFISYFKLPYEGWYKGGMDRLEKYYFRILGKRITLPPNTGSNHIIKIFLSGFYKKRKIPNDLQLYGGWTWWSITREAAEYITNLITRRPDYLNIYRFSHAPDEMFFQTILLNSDNKNIKDSIVNKTLTYTKWMPSQPHPQILTINEYNELIKTDKLFARKFDTEIDSKILDLIDKEILNHTK